MRRSFGRRGGGLRLRDGDRLEYRRITSFRNGDSHPRRGDARVRVFEFRAQPAGLVAHHGMGLRGPTGARVFDSQQAQYICTDQGGRSSLAVRARLTARLGTQQADQYGRISADMPMNWIPILGTHNSFSNFQDGGNNILNVDQELTITDQLWLGSRSVRLDPLMKSTGQSVILCHMSSIGDSTSALLSAAQYFLGITLPTNESELCATDLGSPVPRKYC